MDDAASFHPTSLARGELNRPPGAIEETA